MFKEIRDLFQRILNVTERLLTDKWIDARQRTYCSPLGPVCTHFRVVRDCD